MAKLETEIVTKEQELKKTQDRVDKRRKEYYDSRESHSTKLAELQAEKSKTKAQTKQLKEGQDSKGDLEARLRQLKA